jgi:hypothetical protein
VRRTGTLPGSAHPIPAGQQPGLLIAYQEITHDIFADETLAGQ